MTNPAPGRYSKRITKVVPEPYGDKPRKGPKGVHLMRKAVHDLWPKLNPGISSLQEILKSVDEGRPSQQGDLIGELFLPFDFRAATQFKLNNVHHSTCIEARKQATVGLGHVTDADSNKQSNAAETLNPLTRTGWQSVLAMLAEDYYQVGNAYLEVRRRGDMARGPITGLHYVPAANVRVVLEDSRGVNLHYKVLNGSSIQRSETGTSGDGSFDLVMAKFGDLADFQRRVRGGGLRGTTGGQGGWSEIIHFQKPSVGLGLSTDRWYGFPDWLAGTGYVEVTQALLQSQFDLFSNRGVPEFLMFLLGARVDEDTWDEMKMTMDGYVGFGQQYKSGMFNIADPNLEVQIEKLALDSVLNGTFFKDMMEVLSTTIVSAHRVPPPIAGIVIPGRMGASNEILNAVMSFQILNIGPEQHNLQTMLGCTLGNEDLNQGLEIPGEGRKLAFADFEFRTIVESMATMMQFLRPMDTASRMREELPTAMAEGRDMDEGLLRDGRSDSTDIARAMDMDLRVQKFMEDPDLVAGVFAHAARAQAAQNGSLRRVK